MSLSAHGSAHTSLVLTAGEAESLANRIQAYLARLRQVQDEHPDIHWDTKAAAEIDSVAYMWATTSMRVIDGVDLQIVPDKRHTYCSGYCHF